MRLPENVTLRQKAEKKLKEKQTVKGSLIAPRDVYDQSEAERMRLLHALQVHQIELEMQNEELKLAVDYAETATSFYDFVPTGYFILNVNGLICQLNLTGAKMVGNGSSSLINSNFRQIITSETRPIFNDFLHSVFESDSRQSCTVKISVDGNSVSYILLEGIISEDEQKCFVTALDITERKLAEEKEQKETQKLLTDLKAENELRRRTEDELRHSNEKFRLLFENNSTAIAIVEADSTISLANDALCEMVGYSKDEIIGTSSKLYVSPDDVESWSQHQHNAIINPEGVPEKSEFKFYKKDGEMRHGLLSLMMIPSTNKIIASFTDITERMQAEEIIKKSEANLNSLINNRNESIWSIDKDYNFIIFNNYFRDEYFVLFNYELKRGMNALEIHSLKLKELWKDNYDKALLGRRISFEYSKKVGDQLHYYEVYLNPIITDGKITGVSALSSVITHRKRAEMALLLSESKYHKLYESMMDGFAFVDMNGAIKECNESFRRMLGYGNKELSLLTYEDITPEKWHTYENKIITEQVITKGYSEVYEKEYRKKDGTIFPVSLRTSLLPSAFGRNEGMWAIVRDITERKQAEEALALEKTLTDAIFNSVPGLIYLYDEDRNLVRWNKKHENMTGYSSEELSQIQMLDWFKGDIESQSAVIAGLKTMMLKGFGSAEANLQKKDGTIIPMYFTASPLNLDDKQYFTGIGIDITERMQAEEDLRKSEELLRKAQMIAHVGNWEIDLKTKMVWASEEAVRIYGFDQTISEVPLSQVLDLVVDNYRSSMDQSLEYLIAREGEFREEYQIKRANDGELRSIFSIAELVFAPDGIPEKVFGVTQDITERKQAEEELRQSEARLRELNATKDKFFSIIAHDLKSPFNSIIGFSNILLKQILEKDYDRIEKYASIIQNSSERAMDLLLNLMEWSKSQTGRMKFSPEFVDIVALINGVVELLIYSAHEKSIKLYTELPRIATTFADPAMINTILRNLITNAIKFTDSNGEIVIYAIQKKDELLVSIRDTGVGISKDGIEKLFRIDKSMSTYGTRNEKGTGLGLILCKEFVEKHYGKIGVESTVGKGSTFWFTIPQR